MRHDDATEIAVAVDRLCRVVAGMFEARADQLGVLAEAAGRGQSALASLRTAMAEERAEDPATGAPDALQSPSGGSGAARAERIMSDLDPAGLLDQLRGSRNAQIQRVDAARRELASITESLAPFLPDRRGGAN